MASISGRVSNRQPLLTVSVRSAQGRYTPVVGVSSAAQIASQDFTAIIDTGSQFCCITLEVVFALGLAQQGTRDFRGVVGGAKGRTFPVQFGLTLTLDHPAAEAPSVRFTQPDDVFLPVAIEGGRTYQVLLGMDFLERFELRVTPGPDSWFKLSIPD